MSYILDALKKAERERGVRQAPTLTTVQLSGTSQEFQIAAREKPTRVVLDPNHLVLMESRFAEAPQ